MIRLAAAVVIAVGLSQTLVHAQSAVFTVGAEPAEVHMSPSTASPVVGTARVGAAIEVRRELGSWIAIAWPGARDGEAFVHVSRGSVARRAIPSDRAAANLSSSAPVVERQTPEAPRADGDIGRQRSPLPPVYVTPPHIVGLGLRMGGLWPGGIGASGRMWQKAVGFQVSVSHQTLTNPLGHPASVFGPYRSERAVSRPRPGGRLRVGAAVYRVGSEPLPAHAAQRDLDCAAAVRRWGRGPGVRRSRDDLRRHAGCRAQRRPRLPVDADVSAGIRPHWSDAVAVGTLVYEVARLGSGLEFKT